MWWVDFEVDFEFDFEFIYLPCSCESPRTNETLTLALTLTLIVQIIVNLPGRPKAVRENLGFLLPPLTHAVFHATSMSPT